MENREVKPFTMWRHFKGATQKYRFEEIIEE